MMSHRLRRLRTIGLIAAGVLAAAIAVTLIATAAVRDQELATVDARFDIRGAERPPDDVVIVRIDDVTFEALQLRWAFPRSIHARVVDVLRRAGAKTIAYDVQFTEPTKRREDAALMDAVARARGKIVLATTEANEWGESAIFGDERRLRRLGGRSGNGNLLADSDGVTRRTPYALERMLGFSVVAAELAEGERIPRERFGPDGSAWIDFAGPPGTIPSVSFSDVHAGAVDPDRFRDKIVVVGVTAPTQQDNHPTAVGGDHPMSGVEIHANSIATVLDDLPLREAPDWLAYALVALLGLAVPLASVVVPRGRGLLAVGVALLLAFTYAAVAQLAFGTGLILPVFVAIAALALGLIGTLAVESMVAAREHESLWNVFKVFQPRHVGEEVMQAGGDRVPGDEAEAVPATVVICDLRDSTGFAERHGGRHRQAIGKWFELMTKAIERHGGDVISYHGDGILAAFEVTVTPADHADRALAAVREMAGPELASFNAWLGAHGFGEPLRMGIGVDSGRVWRHYVGYEGRKQYTLLGDTVNTASRLEEMTKEHGCAVLVSGDTFEAARREPGGMHHIDSLEVRGRRRKKEVFALDLESEPSDIAMR